MNQRRRALGWSTRDLASRAAISQPYVVALERAKDSAVGHSPTPTVELVARLAGAFGVDPLELFSVALRPVGRHTLLVVEDRHRSTLERVRDAADNVDQWICVGSHENPHHPARAAHTIDLGRDRTDGYHPARIATRLGKELRRIGSHIDARDIGLLFDETSVVMTAIDDPQVLLDSERQWAATVTGAAAAAGAHAAWNVCVYELDALRSLPHPLDAAMELMRSHDTIWAARRNDVLEGADGARRLLERLRPAATARAQWSLTTDRLLGELDLAS